MASASAAACSEAGEDWATTETDGRLLCARASSGGRRQTRPVPLAPRHVDGPLRRAARRLRPPREHRRPRQHRKRIHEHVSVPGTVREANRGLRTGERGLEPVHDVRRVSRCRPEPRRHVVGQGVQLSRTSRRISAHCRCAWRAACTATSGPISTSPVAPPRAAWWTSRARDTSGTPRSTSRTSRWAVLRSVAVREDSTARRAPRGERRDRRGLPAGRPTPPPPRAPRCRW